MLLEEASPGSGSPPQPPAPLSKASRLPPPQGLPPRPGPGPCGAGRNSVPEKARPLLSVYSRAQTTRWKSL